MRSEDLLDQELKFKANLISSGKCKNISALRN